MSLFYQAYLLDKYGGRLDIDNLAEELHLAKSTIYNQVAAGTFPIPTYLDGGKRFADFRDMATYLDSCRPRAAIPA